MMQIFFKTLFLVASLMAYLVSVTHAQTLIGIAAPFKGPFADLGLEIRQGVDAAFEQAPGSPGGVGILSEDDSCSVEGGKRAAEKLVQAGVQIVIGHPCWRAALAASDIYAEAGVILIGVGAREPVLTTERAGQTIFRLAGRQDQQVSFLIEQIKKLTEKEKHILVLHDGELYARSLLEPFKAILQKGIKRIVTTVDVRERPLSEETISKLFANNAYELVVILAGQSSSASILQTLSGKLETAMVLGPDSFGHPDFYQSTRDLGVDPLFAFKPVFPMVIDDEKREVIAGYENWYGLQWTAYAAGQIVMNLLPIERPDDRLTVLSTGMFDTVLGPVAFSDNGDADIESFLLYQWAEEGLQLYTYPSPDRS